MNSGNLIRLESGEYFVSKREITVSTLVGSCVAVCLFDPINKIIGMNHYMTTSDYTIKNSQNAAKVGRCAKQAMELVIDKMLELGAKYHFLKAKAFGGAFVLKPSPKLNNGKNSPLWDIGKQNAVYVQSYLKQVKIPLISHDLGGTEGRIIYFDSKNFSVFVRKIKDSTQFYHD